MFIGSKCPFCAKSAAISVLVINGGRTVPLVLGKIIWLEGDIAAEVIKDQEGTLLIKNNSLESWSVVTPSGKNKTVPPHGIMPVRDGIRISFRPIVSPHLTAVISNQIYKGMVLKGYFGNNGSGNTSHFQLIKMPIRCCGGN